MSGPAMARQGDCIGCKVLFENVRDVDGKIPVFFTLNGRRIILQDEESEGESMIFMDFKKLLFPFISMTEGSSVLAKVRSTLRSTYQVLSVHAYASRNLQFFKF